MAEGLKVRGCWSCNYSCKAEWKCCPMCGSPLRMGIQIERDGDSPENRVFDVGVDDADPQT